MSRNLGGGSVMIWAAFCTAGKSEIAWIQTKMNSQNYINLLEDGLISMSEKYFQDDCIFQQDNAAIHTAGIVKQWFADKNFELLDWPARSPDLNPIENLWGSIARKVYKNGKQFNNVLELKEAIREAWTSIPRIELENLVRSMPKRLFEVTTNRVGSTHY